VRPRTPPRRGARGSARGLGRAPPRAKIRNSARPESADRGQPKKPCSGKDIGRLQGVGRRPAVDAWEHPCSRLGTPLPGAAPARSRAAPRRVARRGSGGHRARYRVSWHVPCIARTTQRSGSTARGFPTRLFPIERT
jgi:hypothetical protein